MLAYSWKRMELNYFLWPSGMCPILGQVLPLGLLASWCSLQWDKGCCPKTGEFSSKGQWWLIPRATSEWGRGQSLMLLTEKEHIRNSLTLWLHLVNCSLCLDQYQRPTLVFLAQHCSPLGWGVLVLGVKLHPVKGNGGSSDMTFRASTTAAWDSYTHLIGW